MEHYIYKIVNKITKKYYIGRTSQLKIRWDRHLRELRKGIHHCIYLQRAWNKYGEESFEFVVEQVMFNESKLIDAEQWYLDNQKEEIYNVSYESTGGDLISNHPMKEEIIKKISKTMLKKNKKMTPEERSMKYGSKGKINPMYGKTHTKEAVEKIKQKSKEYYQNHDSYRKDKTFEELFSKEKAKELRQKLSEVAKERTGEKNPFYGKIHSEDTKEKISKANRGRKPVNQRPVSIDGNVYPSVTEASRQLEVVPATIINRIKSKNPKYDRYSYVEGELITH